MTSSSPAIIRSRVDFPHPDGPTRTTNSPSATCRLERVDRPDAVRVDLGDVPRSRCRSCRRPPAGIACAASRRASRIASPCARVARRRARRSGRASASRRRSDRASPRRGRSRAGPRAPRAPSARRHSGTCGSARRAAPGSRAPPPDGARCRRRGTAPRRSSRPGGRGAGRHWDVAVDHAGLAGLHRMDDRRRVLVRARDRHPLAAGELGLDPLELAQVLLAPPDVFAHRDPEALELVVVAHEPRHVLGRVLARLGREEAEATVEGDADASLQLRIAGDRAPRGVDRGRRRRARSGG